MKRHPRRASDRVPGNGGDGVRHERPTRPGDGVSPSSPTCPHCGSTDVELEAGFGSSLMTRQYYCRGCRTVFEWVKWEDDTVDWLGP